MTHLSTIRSGTIHRAAASFLMVLLLTGCQLPPDLSTSGYARIGARHPAQTAYKRIAHRDMAAYSPRQAPPSAQSGDRRPATRVSTDRAVATGIQPVGHYWSPRPPHEAYHVSAPHRPGAAHFAAAGNVFDVADSSHPDFLPAPVSGLGVAPANGNAASAETTYRVAREILPCPVRQVGCRSGRPAWCAPPACDCRPVLDCCCPQRFTFRSDLKGAGRTLRDDALGIVNWNNALLLTAAAGASIAIHQDIDGEVREEVRRHPNRWNGASETLGKFGDVPIQIPSILAVYTYSLWTQDERLHDFSGSLISAYTITGVTTVLLKAAVNTDRPSDDWNGGEYGFPSYHTASSFTIAAVIDEYYGPKAGVPAYLMAGLIGWSRIDERDHDVSDVVFGAALGYVVGKSVAGRHLYGDSRVRLLPYFHPLDGSAGMMLETRY